MNKIRTQFKVKNLSEERQEQWCRRNMVRIRGVPEQRGEDVYQIVNSVFSDTGVNLHPPDISTCHRTGKLRREGHRDILVLFTQRDVKYNVMRNKHKLRRVPRAQGVYIDEDLTVIRARVVRQLRKDGYTVSTYDGKITAKRHQCDDIYVDYPQDFLSLPWDQERFQQLGINPDF